MDVAKWDRDCPRFPPELFANIIDHQDQNALANSSLVCTSWLHFARPRLFSCLLFDQRHIQMYIHDPGIIESPLSTIRPVVKDVVIFDTGTLPFERAEVFQLFSLFKTATGLSYRQYGADSSKHHIKIAETFHNITALTLVGNFRDFRHMATFICAFPFLRTLDVQAGTVFTPTTFSCLECCPSPMLRVLKLECNIMCIVPWLLQLDPIPQISELTLKGLIGWDSSHIGRLLKALGPSLKHLTLVEETDIYCTSYRDIESILLGIQSNSELEYLQISFPITNRSYRLTAHVVQMIISRATSLSLREVLISVNPCLFDPVIWERIDETVASLPSPRLESFKVQMWPIGNDTPSIEQSFPLCHKLGLLRNSLIS